MNILVFSDIESTGQWLATQHLIVTLKKIAPESKIHLLYYGENKLLLDKSLFATCKIISRPPLIPPFRYYRQIVLEILNQIKKTHKVIANTGKIDLIITTEYSFLFSAKIALPLTRLFFCFHGFKHFYRLNLENFNLYMFLLKFLERSSWLLSHAIILPSENVKSVIQKEVGIFYMFKKIIVIPNTIPKYFKIKYNQTSLKKYRNRLGIPTNVQVILYVGRIAEKKGLEKLLLAFSLTKKVVKNLCLVLVHPSFNVNGTVSENITRIIVLKKLKSSVFFLKDIPREKLAKIYQMADCAVLPSELEMNSLFLMESLASRLPIFSTPVGNAPNMLHPIAKLFILKDNNPSTISESLIKYFLQPLSWRDKIKLKMEHLSRRSDNLTIDENISRLFH